MYGIPKNFIIKNYICIYPVSGQCGCMDGFLLHIEKNGSMSCYQEFLQGPCPKHQEYVLPHDSDEPACVPTGSLRGSDLFSGRKKKCQKGYGKGPRGKCRRNITKNKIRPPRSSTIGPGKRKLRNICCG